MMQFVTAIVQRFRKWLTWRRPAPAPRRAPASSSQAVEETGRYYFRHDILDKLDEYFDVIKRLRRGDRDSYELYSRIGAHLVNPNTLFDVSGDLGPQWRAGERPGFGAIACLFEDTTKTFNAKFAYFQAIKRHRPGVQATNMHMYELTLFYAPKSDPKLTLPLSVHVAASDDGWVFPLREFHHKRRAIKGKRGTFYVPDRNWRLPRGLELWAEEHKVTPLQFVSSLFSTLVQTQLGATGDIRVRAERNGVVAVFSLDMLRTPYFFRDRNVTVNVNGNRRKIFHIVRTHERNTRWGRTFVRSHFRGERKFVWNGYQLNITMPGWHHGDSVRFEGLGAHEYDDDEATPAGMVDTAETGRRLDAALNK